MEDRLQLNHSNRQQYSSGGWVCVSAGGVNIVCSSHTYHYNTGECGGRVSGMEGG